MSSDDGAVLDVEPPDCHDATSDLASGVPTSVGVVFAAFAAAHLPGFIATRHLHMAFKGPVSWQRWDANHYRDIVERGYNVVHCVDSVTGPTADWCGSAGWFPGYPYAARLIPGMRVDVAMLIVARLSLLLLLAVLWFGFLRKRPVRESLPIIALAAVFPGSVYYLALFPVALAVLGLLVMFYGIDRQRFVIAAVGSATAAFTYPIAGLAGIAASAALVVFDLSKRRRLARAIVPAVGSVVGMSTVFAIMRVQTGRWAAFFTVQASYRHERSIPIVNIFRRIKGVIDPVNSSTAVIAAQHLVTLVTVVLTVGSVIRRRRTVTGFEWSVVGAVVTMYLASHVLGETASVYRHEALLLPVLLVAPFRSTRHWALAAVSSIVVLQMTTFFFSDALR
jgi:hypothetical protein